MRLAHIDNLHGLSMMRSSRICRLHSSTEEVFYSPNDEGSVENSIDLDAEEGRGYLLSQTLWRDVSANFVRPLVGGIPCSGRRRTARHPW